MQKFLKVNQCTARSVKSLFTKKAGKRTLRCYATNQAELDESDIQRQQKMRNIGISAHIDSGKTTLTERVLYYTGRIKEIHEVKGKDNVGATMDSMDLEREKGITIQSAATHCSWKDYQINIIDTPGHVDFTIEVERALRVLDGAILVLCGVSGVQSQTITVDRQMKRYDVPRLMFVNKLDRRGADPYNVTNQVREKLRINASMTQVPIGVEDRHEGVIDVIERIAYYFEGPKGDNIVQKPIPEHLREEVEDVRKTLIERLGDIDDVIAEKFLMEEEPTVEEINAAIRRQTIKRAFVPVFCGSAYKNKGVQLLLDAVLKYLPNPMEVPNFGLNRDQNEEKTELASSAKNNFVGLAFKLEEGKFGQLTYMRIYQGTMKRGETIFNTANDKKIKVPRLVRMHANQMEDINEVKAGDICAMFGVDCASGDTFTDGKSSYTMESMFVPEPVVSLSVVPKIKTQAANFAKALGRFQREDPTFKVVLDPESNQTLIQGMGELHLEIYVERMKREYDCEVITGKPYVAYRETITKKANFDYLHKKQSGGAGQYARVIGFMEPIPIEDGEEKFVFENHIIGNAISPNYISACEKGFKEACIKGGLTEHPVWGVRVVLTDGVTHVVDSSELAFKIASQYAFRQAFDKADACILEPVMKVEVQAPSEFQGNILGGLNRRRGVICDTISQIDYTQVEAEIPLAEMFGYSNELRSLTQGKGEFSMEYKMHQLVPPHVQEKVVREHKQDKEAKAKSKE